MNPITRRRLLENTAKGGLALGAGGLIAACGLGSSSSTPRPPTVNGGRRDAQARRHPAAPA